MNKKSNIGVWIFIATIALCIALVMMFSRGPVNWDAEYSLDHNHPYGISFLYDLLEDQMGKDRFELIESSFDEVYAKLDSTEQYTYLFIGYGRDYDSLEMISMLEFVAAGNSFLSSGEYVCDVLLDTLLNHPCQRWRSTNYYYDDGNDDSDDDSTTSKFSDSLEAVFAELFADDEWEDSLFEEESEIGIIEIPDSSTLDLSMDTALAWDTTETNGYWYSDYTEFHYESAVAANFENHQYCLDSGYGFTHYYEGDTQSRHWSHFNGDCLLDSSNKVQVLGTTTGDKINFIRIPYGKGYFYVHTNPMFLTNFELLEEHRLDYVEKLFSGIPEGTILWDDYEEINTFNWGTDIEHEDSPLSYILSEPALKWSLYLLLMGSFLYIVFRAKRRQRLIPVIEPNVNTSLEFVEMMGQLYFEQKDHGYIARQLWVQFMDFIRSHYYLSAHELKTEWIKKLADKSKVAQNRLKGIERAYAQSVQEGCTEEDLTNLYDKLKYFYANCK